MDAGVVIAKGTAAAEVAATKAADADAAAAEDRPRASTVSVELVGMNEATQSFSPMRASAVAVTDALRREAGSRERFVRLRRVVGARLTPLEVWRALRDPADGERGLPNAAPVSLQEVEGVEDNFGAAVLCFNAMMAGSAVTIA